MDILEAYDLGTLYFFGGQHRPWLDPIVLVLTRLGNLEVIGPFTVGVFLLLMLKGQRRYARGFARLALSAWAVEWVVKLLVQRPRPSVAWRLIDLPSMPSFLDGFGFGSIQPSFPSGHALNSMVIYTTAGILFGRILNKRWLGVAGFALAILIGLTRPYVGVHYPKDVVAGWLGGLAWALIGTWLIGPPETPRLPAAKGTTSARPVA